MIPLHNLGIPWSEFSLPEPPYPIGADHPGNLAVQLAARLKDSPNQYETVQDILRIAGPHNCRIKIFQQRPLHRHGRLENSMTAAHIAAPFFDGSCLGFSYIEAQETWRSEPGGQPLYGSPHFSGFAYNIAVLIKCPPAQEEGENAV